MSYIQQAFNLVCENAQEAESWFVVLMERCPFFVSPAEGGTWSSDSIVVAYQEFVSEKLARQAAKKAERLAKELQQQAQQEYGEHCLRTMEWLDQRGLDADFLPEPDGPSEYFICVTDEIPQNQYGSRYYE